MSLRLNRLTQLQGKHYVTNIFPLEAKFPSPLLHKLSLRDQPWNVEAHRLQLHFFRESGIESYILWSRNQIFLMAEKALQHNAISQVLEVDFDALAGNRIEAFPHLIYRWLPFLAKVQLAQSWKQHEWMSSLSRSGQPTEIIQITDVDKRFRQSKSFKFPLPRLSFEYSESLEQPGLAISLHHSIFTRKAPYVKRGAITQCYRQEGSYWLPDYLTYHQKRLQLMNASDIKVESRDDILFHTDERSQLPGRPAITFIDRVVHAASQLTFLKSTPMTIPTTQRKEEGKTKIYSGGKVTDFAVQFGGNGEASQYVDNPGLSLHTLLTQSALPDQCQAVQKLQQHKDVAPHTVVTSSQLPIRRLIVIGTKSFHTFAKYILEGIPIQGMTDTPLHQRVGLCHRIPLNVIYQLVKNSEDISSYEEILNSDDLYNAYLIETQLESNFWGSTEDSKPIIKKNLDTLRGIPTQFIHRDTYKALLEKPGKSLQAYINTVELQLAFMVGCPLIQPNRELLSQLHQPLIIGFDYKKAISHSSNLFVLTREDQIIPVDDSQGDYFINCALYDPTHHQIQCGFQNRLFTGCPAMRAMHLDDLIETLMAWLSNVRPDTMDRPILLYFQRRDYATNHEVAQIVEGLHSVLKKDDIVIKSSIQEELRLFKPRSIKSNFQGKDWLPDRDRIVTVKGKSHWFHFSTSEAPFGSIDIRNYLESTQWSKTMLPRLVRFTPHPAPINSDYFKLTLHLAKLSVKSLRPLNFPLPLQLSNKMLNDKFGSL